MAWAAVVQNTSWPRPERPQRPTSNHRAQALRLGQQVVLGGLAAGQAGGAYADLADARIRDCAAAAFGDRKLLQKRISIIAVGALGARQMTAASPIDLMVVHDVDPGDDADRLAWQIDDAFQALICSASGSPRDTLYTVRAHAGGSMQAVDARLQAARPAQLFALPQARVVWSTSPALSARLRGAVANVLAQPQDYSECAYEASVVRRLMAWRAPSRGVWDCEREPGGLDDIETLVRRLQVAHAAEGASMAGPAGEALDALHVEGFLDDAVFEPIYAAWTLQQRVSQTFAAAAPAGCDPETQPAAIQAVLACAAGNRDLASLKTALIAARAEAWAAIASLG